MAGDSVIVILNGSPFTGWEDVKISQAFDQATGEGELTISEQPGNPLPADVGDTAQIILAGQPVLTGHVHAVHARHDHKRHPIRLTLRDKTQDLIDSTIGPKQEYPAETTLKKVAEGTLQKMGLSSIGVIDKANPDPYRKGGELPKAMRDTGGFDWLDMWARKRQVVLTTDGKGNLVIDRNQKRRLGGFLYKSFEDSPLNNILRAEYSNSDFGRHNKHVCAGQKSPNDPDWETKAKGYAPGQADPMSKNVREAIDSSVRPERRLHYTAGVGVEGDSPERAAKWRANLARARKYTFNATVAGFTCQSGQLWWPGFVIPVRDDHFLISDELFIKEVTFHKDWKGGATTQVHCTFGDAYSDKAEAGKSRTGKAGLGAKPTGSY